MNKKSTIFFGTAVVVNTLLLIATLILNNYIVSPLVPLLPATYLLCFFVLMLKRPKVFKSISILIILGTFFVRIVAFPAIYVLSNYASLVAIDAVNINNATLLQIWEFLCVFMMILSSKKILELTDNRRKIERIDLDRIKTITKFIILVLIAIILFCILADKSVLTQISTIFNRFFDSKSEKIAKRILLIQYKSNFSIFDNLFLTTIYYLQILIPAYFISLLANIKTKNKHFYGILFVSIASTFILTDDNLNSVCILFACLVVLYNLYENKTKKIMPILGTIFIAFVFLFLLEKSNLLEEGFDISDVSKLINAYFAGLPNVGLSLSLSYSNKFLTLIGDILSGVPYICVFFKGLPQSVNMYNTSLYGIEGQINQIMPLISYGYQYFWILAPFLTILCYKLALFFENKANLSYSAFNKLIYSFIFINLSIGPCLLGLPSIIKRLCLFIPLLILIKINTKKENITNNDNTTST